MSFSFTRTLEQLRDMVARKIGIKESGQTLGAEDAAILNEAIDLRLKELHRLGVLWFNVAGASTAITLTAGQATAAIAATDYLFPVSLMLTVGLDQQPVEIISHSAYQAITDKATKGEPTVAYFSGATMRLHPAPNLAYVAHLTYQAIATDTATGAAPDVPVEMMRAFAVLVAGDLVDDFDLRPDRAARLLTQAGPAMQTIRALNAQRVDTTPVTPDWF